MKEKVTADNLEDAIRELGRQGERVKLFNVHIAYRERIDPKHSPLYAALTLPWALQTERVEDIVGMVLKDVSKDPEERRWQAAKFNSLLL